MKVQDSIAAETRRSAASAMFPFKGWHRTLVLDLAKRDVFGRYRGASLGMGWSVLNPFLMLAVYTLAFGEILRSRWPGADSTLEFSIILFVGLIIHGFFAECLTRAPSLVIGNANYVKRIVFPLEVLPWPMVLSALFHLGMNFLVFVLGSLLVRHSVPWTIILLPVVIIPLILIALGTVWLVSALGVFFRDIGQLVAPLSTALLFLSSAIVPVDVLPERYQSIFRLNPLTPVIDEARAVALYGELPDFTGLAVYVVVALLWCRVAYGYFQKTRRGFADVL